MRLSYHSTGSSQQTSAKASSSNYVHSADKRMLSFSRQLGKNKKLKKRE